ncbi:hypothetical protein GCM10028807_26710 [Spirosoma daeguense]
MKQIIYLGLLGFSFSAVGQTIEVPSGTPLTVQGNLNMPTGFSIQYNAQNYIKAPNTGSNSVYMGLESGNTGAGINNAFIGHQAGKANTGGGNAFLGAQAGSNNTSGAANVFVGYQAGITNTTGTGNLYLGQQSGANSNGSYNLFMGNGSGNGNTAGTGNTAIGDGVFFKNTTGGENVSIGRYAGYHNVTGSNNTFIGVAASPPNGTGALNNATAIGYNSVVSASNAMILGNTSVNVGIGNSAPQNKLEITKGTAHQSGLRFTNLTSSSPASATNQTKVLSVNSSGDVILVSTNASAREGVAENFWQRKGSFLQSTQDDAVIIGSSTRTPAGYKLFVEQGILTEKVKVAVKNTADWSDYVFASDYKLKSLSEVERFIKANKHLPGMPSAEEMVQKGNDLHQTDAKLLAQIEQVVLHSIELEKANNAQKSQIEQLQQEKQQTEQRLQSQIDDLKKLVNQLVEKK